MPVPTFNNKVGLSKSLLDDLIGRFQPLREFGDLHPRLLRYLLDDVDPASIDDLRKAKDAAAMLHLSCVRQSFEPPQWTTFFATYEPIPLFYYRLGKLFEAAAQHVDRSRFFLVEYLDNALWLELLLSESTGVSARMWSARPTCLFPAPAIVQMLQADGQDAIAFIEAAFYHAPDNWENFARRDLLASIPQMADLFEDHPERIRPFISDGSAASRQYAVENLATSKTSPEPFIEELVAAAVGSAKGLREVAEGLIRKMPPTAQPYLERIAKEGKAGERTHAIRLLVRMIGEAAAATLQGLQSSEKSAKVQEAIAAGLRELSPEESGAELSLDPPPRQPIDLSPPFTDQLQALVTSLFDEHDTLAAQHAEYLKNTPQPRGYVFPHEPTKALTKKQRADVTRYLKEGGKVVSLEPLLHFCMPWMQKAVAMQALLEHPDCRAVHVARLGAVLDYVYPPVNNRCGIENAFTLLLQLFRNAHAPLTLLDASEAIDSLGLPGQTMLADFILPSYSLLFAWEAESVWPFWLDKLDRFAKAFEPAAGKWESRYQRQREFDNTLRILALFPQVPPALLGKLWELAVGTNKSHRMAAQQVLVGTDDVQQRLAEALQSRTYQTRDAAADWLGRLGDKQAAAALHRAAKKEKRDATLDTILTALEKLDEPIQAYLDRGKLAKAALKGLKKGVPEPLEQFNLDDLPSVAWADSGETVDPQIIRWLLVQNYKQKSPEAGPLLRRYCDQIRAEDRTQLGDYVLNTWFAYDLEPIHTEAEAQAEAKRLAANWMQHTGGSGFTNLSEMEKYYYQQQISATRSGVKIKGVLAVAGACCDASAVPPVQAYLKKWYGYRAAQCKALLGMLSTIDADEAIAYLLSISQRFRTAGIRDEATKYVQHVAERKAWSHAELGDRTMPTAGFDRHGKLEISYGERSFHAAVTPELTIQLSDAEGKSLKSLPAARKSEDEAVVKAAKKTFSTAKSALKKFAKSQAERLYEAMCTQRTWSLEDWRNYLWGHPLCRHLCQRLIWSVVGEEEPATFRPLDDGSLTDCQDEELTLEDKSELRLAHRLFVSDVAAQEWEQHFADYDIAPLFPQLQPSYSLPQNQPTAIAIEEFQGHVLPAFTLRNKATAMGYTRGQPQDGGWFYQYEKRFTSLGLEARIEFSGNSLPEENRTASLRRLCFRRLPPPDAPADAFSGDAPLKEIPSVLLSECYSNLRALAESGPGFDPDWERLPN